MSTGVYIHIPFCVSKCFYCDFLSFKTDDIPPGYMEGYKDSLIKEINNNRSKAALTETVYIGGGTPTALPDDYLLEIIESVNLYPLSRDFEFTVEANPGAVSAKTLQKLFNAGVNRLSFGLQTANDVTLKKIGRIHTARDFTESCNAALSSGFTNINADLMYAFPLGDTNPEKANDDLIKDLEFVIAANPAHISAYPLTLEKGTVFENLEPMDDSAVLGMFETVKRRLKNAGYIHYEISNFAKPGYESRHNTAYWRRGDYMGMGLGAHSFAGGIRYENTGNLKDYIIAAGDAEKLLKSSVFIDKNGAMEEFFFLGLRMTDGVSLSEFYKQFSLNAEDVFGGGIREMKAAGLLASCGDRLFLTDRGRNLSNYVFLRILTN